MPKSRQQPRPSNPIRLSETDKIAILGKSGSGKTYLAMKLLAYFPRAVIFDRMNEYGGSGRDTFVVTSYAGFAQRLKETLTASQFRIVYRFNVESDNHDAEFNEALRLCYFRYRFSKTSLRIMIDEVHNFATPHYLPKYLKECYLTGRHQKIGITACSQRPANVHKDVLAQSQHVFCSQFSEPNDLNYLRERIGAAAEELPDLPPTRHFLHCADGQAPVIRRT